MSNFIDIAELSKKDLRLIIENAKQKKRKRKNLQKNSIDTKTPLKGKLMVMIFEQPSSRTRMSFDIAAKQLGGHSIILNPKDSQFGSGNESFSDTAKLLSEYADIVILRTKSHKNLLTFKKNLNIPIINGLTNLSHPCQIMSDIMTFEELKGPIKNRKISWIGDGNNILYSLIEASVKFEFQLSIACPKQFQPNIKVLKWAKKNKGNISIFFDPRKAVISADCVMTDKWISMNDKINKKRKKKILKKFQVNNQLLKVAKKDAIFMHCLPASRGEEVTSKVMDGKQSAVWLEAFNRIHIQKSIIEWCLK